MMKPSSERLDLTVYLRAFGVLVRNPTVIVLPLLAGVIGVLVEQLSDVGGGGLLAGLTTFLLLLIQLFALGVAIIIGDMGWRHGKASFDDAWQDARTKGRDILFAAFGFTFVLSIAQYAGTILPGVIAIILVAIAVYALIFTIAAASIGGIPGSAAISVSIERVRSAPMTAALLTVVTLVLMLYVAHNLDLLVFESLGVTSPLIGSLLDALFQSLVTGYIAIVMAKVYTDVSFTPPPRW
jgi:hypothetical protein